MDPNRLAPWLQQLIKHSPLNEEHRVALLNLPRRITMVDGETYLVRDGDTAQQCFVLLTGYAYQIAQRPNIVRRASA